MEDGQIIELYWARSEAAVTETSNKYGKYCHTVAFNILHSSEDAEECVNDTYLRAWAAIPPKRPNCLAAFLGKITRNLSLNRYEKSAAEKRGSGQVTLALDELRDCIPASGSAEQAVEDAELTEILNRFLSALSKDARRMFILRYWYLYPIGEIAKRGNFSESKVKMTLLRARKELKQMLEREDIAL